MTFPEMQSVNIRNRVPIGRVRFRKAIPSFSQFIDVSSIHRLFVFHHILHTYHRQHLHDEILWTCFSYPSPHNFNTIQVLIQNCGRGNVMGEVHHRVNKNQPVRAITSQYNSANIIPSLLKPFLILSSNIAITFWTGLFPSDLSKSYRLPSVLYISSHPSLWFCRNNIQ